MSWGFCQFRTENIPEGPEIRHVWDGRLECSFFFMRVLNGSWPLLRQSGLLIWKSWAIGMRLKQKYKNKLRRKCISYEERTQRAGLNF